ncbi:hypothetical protein [Chitinimonas koreensis]|uniref:hypothetical protein n=1 Tax=Chitinimonas koreensis TaxID=356302 RepID=UPI0004098458|nr:hypothetical protein [Chitinimonas koreensis]QNM95351.1 hypothetical protein H9L41_15940 [Chitinimonas koreensis]
MTDAEPDLDAVEAVAAAILRYLTIRPQAADTLEGIHRWWIDWAAGEESPELTERALDALVGRGQLECVEIAGRRIWRAARPA